jgi:pimeloyl-ACP methyl ester carboxylesterase
MITLLHPDRAHHLTRDGGRRVGWTEWGPSSGAPVLFCTGAGMTSSMGLAGDAVHELGVRLVCVDRAGLGRSDPDPDKSFARWAEDVAAVLASQGIARAPAIGLSQGAPFAIALAAAGFASSVAIVSGQDELAHPAMREKLHPHVAAMVAAIAADRAGFEASFAARADAAGLWALVLGMSSAPDRAIYEEPAFAAAYRATLHEGFAQGAGGYVRDLTLAMSPWPTPPEAITVPVTLWYGLLDTSPVHSPDFGATLATRFPRATRRTFPDEGGALLWTRSAEILGAIDR